MKNIHVIFWMGIMLAAMPVVASEDSDSESERSESDSSPDFGCVAKRSKTNAGRAAAGGRAACRKRPSESRLISTWKKKPRDLDKAYAYTLKRLQTILSDMRPRSILGRCIVVSMVNLEGALQASDAWKHGLKEEQKNKIDELILEVKEKAAASYTAEVKDKIDQAVSLDQLRAMWLLEKLANAEDDIAATQHFFTSFKYRESTDPVLNRVTLAELLPFIRNTPAFKKITRNQKRSLGSTCREAIGHIKEAKEKEAADVLKKAKENEAADVMVQLGTWVHDSGGSADDAEQGTDS